MSEFPSSSIVKDSNLAFLNPAEDSIGLNRGDPPEKALSLNSQLKEKQLALKEVLEDHEMEIKQKAKELSVDIRIDVSNSFLYYNGGNIEHKKLLEFIRRLEFKKLLPKYWSGEEEFSREKIPRDREFPIRNKESAEYEDIIGRFQNEMDDICDMDTMEIRRSHNYKLMLNWIEKCLEFHKHYPGANLLRKILYYGSDNVNPKSIIKHSFSKDCFRNGPYGKGIYFYETPNAAHKKCYQDREKMVILGMVVLLGKVVDTTKGEKHDPNDKMVTLIGKDGEDKCYVVYEENMAYPYYVLEYEEPM
jgi:Poly(ADP-ribose) polymerase catalytic domain.